MAQYPNAEPSIPRATDSDYSDDPVVGFPALTDRLADEVEAITSELGTDPSGASATVKARIEAVESGKVSTSDSRLTDSRTPTAHKTSHATGGSDALSPSDIGAATSGHTHSGTYELAGTVASHEADTTNVHGIVDTSALVLTSDSRLTDSRTPTAHAHAEVDVTGLVTDLAGKVGTARAISTTAPLSGGGDLSADRTLSIADASTTQKGAVQLNSSTTSTSTTEAATPSAVKSAYDLAVMSGTAATAAQTTANAAIPKSTVTAVGDLIIGNGSGAVTNLAKGSSGQVLQASAFGLQWATPSSGGYSTVQDEGTARTSRSAIDFQGYGVSATDDATNSKTVVTVQGNYETPAVGLYLAPLFTTWDTDLANVTQVIHFCRITVPVNGMTFNQIRFKCKTAGASSSIRFGVYGALNAINFYQPTGVPIDWGTVSTTGTAGLNLSLNLPSVWQPTAGIYWLAAVSQGTNNSTISACNTFSLDHVLPSWGTNIGSWSWKSSGTHAGALPTSPAVTQTAQTAPLIAIARSA